MLKEKDKEVIRKIFQEELRDALFRTLTIERGPRKQGDFEKVIKEEEWNVLDFLVTYIPKIEGAMRGMQADIDKLKNRTAEYNDRLNIVGQTVIGMEEAAQIMVKLAARGKELGLLQKEPQEVLIDASKT